MKFPWFQFMRNSATEAEKLLDANTELTRKASAKLDDLVEEATTVFDRRQLPDKERLLGERRKRVATG